MSVFNFRSYKFFVRSKVKAMAHGGRGEFQKMAAAMQMHTTNISQVFRGDKQLTAEQAAKLAKYWGLTVLESDYFVNLVELERAGARELKELLEIRLQALLEQSRQLSQRVPKDRVLSEADRQRFYSSWIYPAIRLLCDIPDYQNADRISDRLNLPKKTVNDALEFLISSGLVVQQGNVIKLGPQRTYLEASSPFIARHHANWRVKALERLEQINPKQDLVFTSPMTLSRKDALLVREKIAEFVQEIMKINTASPSEALHFLNIDWLEF